MNRALVLKSCRESAWLVVAALVTVVLFEVFFVTAMKNVAPEMIGFMRRFAFLRMIFQALVSIDLSAASSPTALVTLGLLHPFLSTVTWGTLVTAGTRLPCGEVDRGTADLLLSLPVSRGSVYTAHNLVCGAIALALAVASWSGIALGTRLIEFPQPIDLGRVAQAGLNQAALLLAIGGTTALASTVFNRRGAAVAVVVGLLLASFLVNFLAVFIDFFKQVEFLGFLHYYRPVDVVRDGRPPWRNLAVLAGLAALTWTAGLLWFGRKDVPVS